MSKRADSIILRLPTIESILGCRCIAVICLPRNVVIIQFLRNTFSCMERSVVVARMFYSRVCEVQTYMGKKTDTSCHRTIDGWVAKEPDA